MSIPKSLRIFLLSAIILMSSDFGLLACEGSFRSGILYTGYDAGTEILNPNSTCYERLNPT